MKRRQMFMLPGAALAMHRGSALGQPQTTSAANPAQSQGLPATLLLKDFRPQSIYKIPRTEVKKAKFPVVDVHVHARQPDAVPGWVKIMDAAGIEKAVIFAGTAVPEAFAEAAKAFKAYPGRFDLWCGLDFTGVDQPGFGPNAVKALEGCHRAGALGVGEISDKGWGYRPPRAGGRGAGGGAAPAAPQTPGPHADDPRMDPVWQACARLAMPINVHFSDPIWSYLPMDNTNDGLMNAWTWRIDDKVPGILGHDALIQVLERAAGRHPRTIFIACHLANLDYDLTRLGQMFERHPNLFADISARYGELAPIPRFVNQFLHKYPDRVCYGTDMTYSQSMFSNTFRVLETNDEHFYDNHQYHSPLYGFGLPDAILKKLYRENALAIFQRARKNAG
jgi:uncharacterized protein